MGFSLQDFFDFPHVPGYVRWPDNGKCYYIPTEDLKRIMLEDLQSTKYFEAINCE